MNIGSVGSNLPVTYTTKAVAKSEPKPMPSGTEDKVELGGFAHAEYDLNTEKVLGRMVVGAIGGAAVLALSGGGILATAAIGAAIWGGIGAVTGAAVGFISGAIVKAPVAGIVTGAGIGGLRGALGGAAKGLFWAVLPVF